MIDRILAKRIVPVIVLDDASSAEPLAEALLKVAHQCGVPLRSK